MCSLIEDQLAKDVGEARFDRYFRNTAQLALDEGGLTVALPSAFLASWLEGTFDGPLRAAARKVTGDPALEVRWRVAPEVSVSGLAQRPQAEQSSEAIAPKRRQAGNLGASATAPAKGARRVASHGKRRSDALTSTLDSFVVGEANKLAFSAAREIVHGSIGSGFRTLFIHGDCGVGKTHLLQGIAHAERVAPHRSRVRYTTAEAFTNEYIRAVRAGDLDAFRSAYRRLDLLCIDDVHFIAGKSGTQNEFLHTFDALDLARGRVALASDAHPSEIARLNHRLVSRCLAGMVVRIEWPDAGIRREIARRRASQRGLVLSEDALRELSSETIGSVRDLEGVMARVEALVRLLPDLTPRTGEVPAAIVRKAVQPAQAARPVRPVRLKTVIQVVLDELRVESDDICGRGRHGRVVLARSLIAYLSRQLTTHSFPEIARSIGRPNHSTVVTACQRIERRLGAGDRCDELRGESEMTLAELCGRLSRRILETSGASNR